MEPVWNFSNIIGATSTVIGVIFLVLNNFQFVSNTDDGLKLNIRTIAGLILGLLLLTGGVVIGFA